MKPSPLEHLPGRSMFADVNDNTVHAPKPVNDIIVHAQRQCRVLRGYWLG